ncbi:hypothetical protein G7084_05095 [Weissella coleopterorum]|uniref:Transposase IS30-like HTH domain-containing protein n=1 Tax=Weissella coleopterorum TaxID=2714949 RepID=A0A6G8B0A8_9LACO|nr:hypothetical protein G7084_05095 [Weissella coleopterorum]
MRHDSLSINSIAKSLNRTSTISRELNRNKYSTSKIQSRYHTYKTHCGIKAIIK